MADHRQLVLLRAASMNVAVATAHRSLSRSKISSGNVDQRFAKRRTPGLIANQGREDVALLQKHSTRSADRFLSATEIHTAGDHSAAIETGQLIFEHARQ